MDWFRELGIGNDYETFATRPMPGHGIIDGEHLALHFKRAIGVRMRATHNKQALHVKARVLDRFGKDPRWI